MTATAVVRAQETPLARARKQVAAMKNERSSFDAHYREIADWIKPRRTRFQTSDRNRGDRRNQKIIDSRATFASRTLSSGLMSGVTSPARPWFRLAPPDPDLGEFGPVKDWLHIVRTLMLTVFQRSNLYSKLPVVYGDLGNFATGAMFVREDDATVIRCFDHPVGSYYLANDENLDVRVFGREYEMTVRQIVGQFARVPGTARDLDWSKVSGPIKTAWDNSNYEEWIPVTHLVQPNDDYDPNRLHAKYKPFSSCYYETANRDQQFLLESGYDEFPVLAPRWEMTGEDVYGTDCPGMTALGDVKALQLMKKFGLQAIEKMVKPPMVAPPEMRTSKLSILPGDVSYVAEGPNKSFRPAMQVNLNLNDLRQETAEVKQLIDQAYFVDLFLMLENLDRKEITATEIMERKEEKLLALGPVFTRLDSDLLHPLIDRTYAIMERKGMLPPPPPELDGATLRVEYESVMAQAQRAVATGGLERFTGFVTNLAAEDPTVWDKVDRDQMIDEYAQMTGVPPRVVVPDDKVAEVRQARAQQQQAAQAAELASKVAPAVRDLSQSPTTGDNALASLLSAGGGQVAGLLGAGSPA
jgi:hypothetical protein